MDVKIQLRQLHQLATIKIPTYRTYLARASAGFVHLQKNITSPDPAIASLLALVSFNIEAVRYSIWALQDLSPRATLLGKPHAHTRSKRGLFDLGGRVLGGVFGLATTRDLQEVDSQLNAYAEVLDAQATVLEEHAQAVTTLAATQDLILGRMKILPDELTVLQSHSITMFHLLVLSQKVKLVLVASGALRHSLEMCYKIITQVSRGIVTPELLTPHQLDNIVDASVARGFKPLFDKTNIEYYYPYLAATLTPDSVLVHIPFRTTDAYTLHQVYQFPTVFNSIYALRFPYNFLLVSHDFMHIAFPTFADLSSCHTGAFQIRLCLGHQFVFLPARDNLCALYLARNGPLESSCHYHQLESHSVFHQRVKPRHFLYFPNQTSVTISCPNIQPTSSLVQSSYVLLDAISLTSSDLLTQPSTHLLFNRTLHPPALLNFTLQAPSVPLVIPTTLRDLPLLKAPKLNLSKVPL